MDWQKPLSEEADMAGATSGGGVGRTCHWFPRRSDMLKRQRSRSQTGFAGAGILELLSWWEGGFTTAVPIRMPCNTSTQPSQSAGDQSCTQGWGRAFFWVRIILWLNFS